MNTYSVYVGDSPIESIIKATSPEEAALLLHKDAGYQPDDTDFPFDISHYQIRLVE